MMKKLKKVKLKGNESFPFREGWLRKGMRLVEEDPSLFRRSDAMELLGLGSKMVKSLKFWLLATNICEEFMIEDGGRLKGMRLTDDFGRIIFEHDPYFDDYFTLTLLHYQITKNQEYTMMWHLFFNEFLPKEFLKENMIEICQVSLEKRMEEGATFSESSLHSDCSSVLAMYLEDSKHHEDPEEKLTCPLSELGLLKKARNGVFLRCSPSVKDLDPLSLLYVMVANLEEGRNSVSFDQLSSGVNNVGKLFHLDRVLLDGYLDTLRTNNYLHLSRSGNLNEVHLRCRKTPREIMLEYYEKQVG